jgi:uncharacterized protein GlcG (DUF336 family)
MRQRFEYLVTKTPADRGVDLNELGEDGWELVHISAVDAHGNQVFYFKRPKSSLAEAAAAFQTANTETPAVAAKTTAKVPNKPAKR